MKKTKLKIMPSDLYELENIRNSDTFAVHDCELGFRSPKVYLTSFAAAKAVVLEPKGRKLVYAYNKKLEDSGATSRFILLTKKVIEMYEEWIKDNNIN
jgi:hypothetical protein